MQHGNRYEAAVEHFANGLSLVEDYGVLFRSLKDNFPPDMYTEIEIQMEEIREMLPTMRNCLPGKCVCN